MSASGPAVVRGTLPASPALLCIAHPGHELRVYGWLTLAQPVVAVLTDGSGRSGRSRLPATRETLGETGCTVGPFFGLLTDADAYRAILARDVSPFAAGVEQLVGAARKLGAHSIIGDMAEGYNPVHDVCRLMINAACAKLGVASHEFPLTGRPDACRDPGVEIRLDDALFARKVAAAQREADLRADVDDAIRVAGADAFRMELMRRASPAGPTDGLPDEPPFYERHGEARVRDGKYAAVLRRREHVLPIALELWRSAQ